MITFFWYLAHHLELALKYSWKTTYFCTIDEMPLRLYYLYEKSPKKCTQLDEVVQELWLCLEEDVRPTSEGNRPLRACGTRFVSHKALALGRVIDKYGVYLNYNVRRSYIQGCRQREVKGVLLAMATL